MEKSTSGKRGSTNNALEDIAKERGFASYADFMEYVAKRRGFASYAVLLQSCLDGSAKKKGFASFEDQQMKQRQESAAKERERLRYNIFRRVSFRSVPEVEERDEKKLREILRELIASNGDVDAAKETIFDVCVYLPQFWNYVLHWARHYRNVALRDWLQRQYGPYLRWAKTRIDSVVWKDEMVKTISYRNDEGERVYLDPFTCVDRVVGKRQFRTVFASSAKRMRNNPTQAEVAMWEILKAKSLGFQFLRQTASTSERM